jgi:tRNA threonylcarbamoyladenosine biosynthesis protein TsaE
MRFEFNLKGPKATTAFGHFLADHLKAGDILTLSGDLGAGKSTLARGLITAILTKGGFDVDDIPSPTFTLVQSYPWPDHDDPEREVWHIDLWRVEDPEEIVELGFDEALGRHAMLIEWPERLGTMLGSQALRFTMAANDMGGRILTITAADDSRWVEILRSASQNEDLLSV